ncbi:BAR domain-containing protein [Trichostrongylus colubriformis]|uniref:BAR domain-containing protein n=1 Tax=Trichostrongylus colubriformis TaxID=6319 RepID=A0AAN8FDP1_TRICO
MNKFYLKAAERIGIVEETKLEPTFEEGIKKVEAYRLAVDGTLDGLEAIMQPNHKVVETGAIVAPPGQNPHELLAAACTKLKQFVESGQQARLDIVINSMNKMAETERSSQTKGRAAVRRLRRFVTVDNQQMKADMEKMREGLEVMDVARHEVKNSKTKEVLEEKGMAYHKSVKAFNDQVITEDH